MVHRYSVLSLLCAIAVSSLLTGSALAGIGCPCEDSVVGSAGVVFACPLGDGDPLHSLGLTITVTLRDCVGNPRAGVPATDIWLIGCGNLLNMCGGRGIGASGPTDGNGRTTITGAIAAGGCALGGVRVVAQGVTIGAGVCGDPCVPIKVKTADLSGDLTVDIVDFAKFGGPTGYPSPPKPYNDCVDYMSPFGTVTLPDFAKYGTHSGHSC